MTEFDRRMAESKTEFDHRMTEFDRRMAESKAESDRRQAEADRRAEEADHRQAEADRRAEEADRRAEEADRRMAQLEKTVERTAKAVDSLTTRWGRFVEELVEPGAIRLFQARGLDVTQTFSRGKVAKQGVAMEIDILAVNGTDLVAVECKSRLSKDDVDYFMEKLKLFKQAFPQYQSFDVYGAVAGIEIDEGIDRYAYKKGLFVIKPSGDMVEIVNNAQFQGRKW
ncbi:MAG: DUF3782 domain-containing protein [Microcystaceae cyanobacterium]